jgi:type I restriction enzyme M protein
LSEYIKLIKHSRIRTVDSDEVLSHNASLNMALYVSNVVVNQEQLTLDEALQNWTESSNALKQSMAQLFEELS